MPCNANSNRTPRFAVADSPARFNVVTKSLCSSIGDRRFKID